MVSKQIVEIVRFYRSILFTLEIIIKEKWSNSIKPLVLLVHVLICRTATNLNNNNN